MDIKIDHQDFLRIMRLVFDTAPAVLAAFIDSRVIEKHKSFKSFLETFKHSLYHKCMPGVCCCKCPGGNCFTKKDRHYAKHVFHQLFQTEKVLLNKSHESKIGIVKTVCICQFTPNDKLTSDFDIETLGLLLNESGLLEDYQKKWLRTMKHLRNELCHLPGTTVLTCKQYEDIWKELEKVIKNLAREVGPGIHFVHSIEREIEYLKRSNFTKEQNSSSVQKFIDAMERTKDRKEEYEHDFLKEIKDKVNEQKKTIKQLQAGLNELLLERHRNVVATATVNSIDTGNYENRLTQTENDDIQKEISTETRNINISCSLPSPKQLVDYQDAPIESSTIGILTQMVLDVFPDIIREWILSHKTIENISKSMTGYVFFGNVNTPLEQCNFPKLLEVARQCKVKNTSILYMISLIRKVLQTLTKTLQMIY